MAGLGLLLRRVLSTGLVVLAFLVVAWIGEQLPFMRDLDAAIRRSRSVYLGAAIAILALGFVSFMGGVIYGSVRAMPSRRVGESVEGAPGRSGGFGIEVSFTEMKAAWRQGLWLTHPWWRFTFFMIAAGTLMVVGAFSVIFVVGFAGLRIVAVGALLYLAALTVWGFRIA